LSPNHLFLPLVTIGRAKTLENVPDKPLINAFFQFYFAFNMAAMEEIWKQLNSELASLDDIDFGQPLHDEQRQNVEDLAQAAGGLQTATAEVVWQEHAAEVDRLFPDPVGVLSNVVEENDTRTSNVEEEQPSQDYVLNTSKEEKEKVDENELDIAHLNWKGPCQLAVVNGVPSLCVPFKTDQLYSQVLQQQQLQQEWNQDQIMTPGLDRPCEEDVPTDDNSTLSVNKAGLGYDVSVAGPLPRANKRASSTITSGALDNDGAIPEGKRICAPKPDVEIALQKQVVRSNEMTNRYDVARNKFFAINLTNYNNRRQGDHLILGLMRTHSDYCQHPIKSCGEKNHKIPNNGSSVLQIDGGQHVELIGGHHGQRVDVGLMNGNEIKAKIHCFSSHPFYVKNSNGVMTKTKNKMTTMWNLHMQGQLEGKAFEKNVHLQCLEQLHPQKNLKKEVKPQNLPAFPPIPGPVA